MFQCRPLFCISSSRILLSNSVPPFIHSLTHLSIYSFIHSANTYGSLTSCQAFWQLCDWVSAPSYLPSGSLCGVSNQHRPFLASESSFQLIQSILYSLAFYCSLQQTLKEVAIIIDSSLQTRVQLLLFTQTSPSKDLLEKSSLRKAASTREGDLAQWF